MITGIFGIRFPEIMIRATNKTGWNSHGIHGYRPSFCMNHIICHLTCASHMKPMALPIYSRTSFVRMDDWRLAQSLFDFIFEIFQVFKTDVFCSNQSCWTNLTSTTVSYTHLTLPTIYSV